MTKYSSNSDDNLLTLDAIKKYSNGLICLSGSIEGPSYKFLLQNNQKKAEEIILNLNSIFKENFFIELSRSVKDYVKKI